MNIFKDDLLKNKYFLIIVAIIGLIVGILYIVDYSSVENRCRRKLKAVGSYFRPKNRLQEMTLDQAMESMVEECVRESGNR